MVIEKKIKRFEQQIKAIKWFENVGKPLKCDDSTVMTLQEAMNYWFSNDTDFVHGCAWELYRRELAKNPDLFKMWQGEFKKYYSIFKECLEKSEKARNLIEAPYESIEEFFNKLPIMGAFGELILSEVNSDYRFFSSQIPYYEQGHWVCGWNGKIKKYKLFYPELSFYVY
jgi:hypothetical protein